MRFTSNSDNKQELSRRSDTSSVPVKVVQVWTLAGDKSQKAIMAEPSSSGRTTTSIALPPIDPESLPVVPASRGPASAILDFANNAIESAALRDGIKLIIVGGALEAARRAFSLIGQQIVEREFRYGAPSGPHVTDKTSFTDRVHDPSSFRRHRHRLHVDFDLVINPNQPSFGTSLPSRDNRQHSNGKMGSGGWILLLA